MNRIALATLVFTAIGAIGAWFAMPGLLTYIRERRQEKTLLAVRVALRQGGRMTRGELWAKTATREEDLNQALKMLVATDEIQVYTDEATHRTMVELRFATQPRRRG